jgi:adenylate cyclase
VRKKIGQGLILGLTAAVLALVFHAAGWLTGWEAATWVWRVRFFAKTSPAADQIRIILLDQASLDWGKNEQSLPWPWPRQVYAPVIQFCRRAGAKAVAFDVLYTEPSAYGVDDDAALGQAIGAGRDFVGAVFLSDKTGDATEWPPFIVESSRGTVVAVDEACRPRVGALTVARASFPIPEVASNAVVLGNVSDEPDGDGVFRRAALVRWFDGRAVPSLGIAAFLAAERAAGRDADVRWNQGWLRIGERRIPVDSRLRAILRYAGGVGAYKAFNVAEIIQSELRLQAGEKAAIDPEEFRDKYVFFGFSAPGLLDLRVTPVSKVYPGVLIHATQLDNLLSQRFLRDVPDWWQGIGTALLAVAAAVVGRLCKRWWHSALTFAAGLPLPLAVGFGAYAAGYWWPVMAGEVGVAAALIGAVVWNYATEGRQKAFIKQAFKHYISPAYIDLLLENPDQLKLGGEKRELTIFFSDLQGFSSFSERLDPEMLTAFLNEYLTYMTDIIQEEGGTLDKYEGDAIIAFWNAPLALPDHAVRACRAALRCQRKLQELNPQFAQRYGHELKMRIGINTGDVVVGNMGSRDRFNYTILGDAANLASRLEGANKAFGTFLMVSETTWNQAKSAFVGRALGAVRVVGRKTPVHVFEVLGLAGEPAPAFLASYEAGLECVRRKQWAQALREFEKTPADPVAKKYADRCRALAGADWDGVWNLTEK